MLTASEFWRLSQALYAAPGVRELCLQAQDEGGAEINLLLLLALLQARGWRGSYRTLLANISQQQPLLRQWGALLRSLKAKVVPADYQRLLEHELGLELWLQQQLLNGLLTSPAPDHHQEQASEMNALAGYLQQLGLTTTPLYHPLLALPALAAALAATSQASEATPSAQEDPC